MGDEILGLLIYCIPALVTGAIAFLFFREHTDNENNRRNFVLTQSLQKEVMPVRLQAYERLALFLERIAAHHLLKRVDPIVNETQAYKDLLISTIEQEYTHNLSQQIYPPMLITTSLFDNRVLYSEPVKYIAKLRDVKEDNNVHISFPDSGGHLSTLILDVKILNE